MSKRSPLKIESDRGTDFYNSKLQMYNIIQDSQTKDRRLLNDSLELYVFFLKSQYLKKEMLIANLHYRLLSNKIKIQSTAQLK